MLIATGFIIASTLASGIFISEITRKPSWLKGYAVTPPSSEPEIVPFAPPTPKTLARTKHGVDRMHHLRDIRLKVYCDLETGVQGHSRSSKAAPFDRTYDFIFIFCSKYTSVYYRFWDIAAYWSKIATPLYSAPPLRVTLSDLCNNPWWRQTRMMGLSDGEENFHDMFSHFDTIHLSHRYTISVWQMDGQTDRRNWRGIYML